MKYYRAMTFKWKLQGWNVKPIYCDLDRVVYLGVEPVSLLLQVNARCAKQSRENGARIRETAVEVAMTTTTTTVAKVVEMAEMAELAASTVAEGGKQRKIKQRKNRVAGKRMRALSAGGNYSDYANSGSVPLLYPDVPQLHRLPAAVCAIFHR